jgi:magnesium chelatase family protein
MSTKCEPGTGIQAKTNAEETPMEIVSFARRGYAGELVKVEADLRRGIPSVDIVGLPDGAVREARERVRAAIRNSGLEYPRERILINLSPASLKKEGSSFDLAIALAVLAAATGLSHRGIPARVMVLGELELSGTVRAVSGILAAVSRGIEEGIREFIVPEGNQAEAAIRREGSLFAVSRLEDAMAALEALAVKADMRGEPPLTGASGMIGTSGTAIAPEPRHDSRNDPERREYVVRWPSALGNAMPNATTSSAANSSAAIEPGTGYEEVRGQARLVRALQIAAAGGHHLIAYGPPGAGKTLALKRFPALLPELGEETAIAVTRIYGIAGAQSGMAGPNGLITRPPFREPHQNTTLEGMIGGGRFCGPGEISLAHGGALFLDEATQFRASVLQALRTPLETGSVTVSRAGITGTFPARFQLLAAINPCPCGNFGAEGRICTCDPLIIERYWKKLTAPLLDRIDLRVQVGLPEAEAIAGTDAHGTFSTAALREGIARARVMQWERNGAADSLNAALSPESVTTHCALNPELARVFVAGLKKARISGRGAHGALKVARTIADMEGSPRIEREHLFEAIQLRRWSIGVPDFLREP